MKVSITYKYKEKDKKSVTLEIDQSIADALGITKNTDLELIVVDDTLIIKAKKTKSNSAKKNKLHDLTKSLMDKYEPVLKKLAKT